MKKLLWSVPLLIILFVLPGWAGVENFMIEWDAVTMNADDTPLTDLSHYQFIVCEAPIDDVGACPLNPHNFQVPADQFETTIDYTTQGREGTIFVRGSAVDTTGNRSALSNTVTMDFKDDVPPSKLTIRIKLP